MSQRCRPDATLAARLTLLDARAHHPAGPMWTEAEYLDFGKSEAIGVFTDPELRAGILVMRIAADEAEILSIAVVAECRRTGIGRALLQAGEAFAKDAGAVMVHLEVADDNLPALKLYTHEGYTQSGIRRRYYQRPEGTRADAFMMKKTL